MILVAVSLEMQVGWVLCSVARVVSLVLEFSHEPSAVYFLEQQLVVQRLQSHVLEPLRANFLLLNGVAHMEILLNAQHHQIKSLEVLGVES